MNRVEVKQKIRVYAVDGREVKIGETIELGVESDRIWNTRVVLVIGEHSYTVIGHDLALATSNAMNVL